MTGPEEARGRRLDRKVLALWWVVSSAWATGALILGIIVAVLVERALLPVALVELVIVSLAAALPPLRYRRWRYEIRSRDLSLAKGALFFVRTLIPFDRIQFVESRQGPLDRFLGLNQLIVYTAAGRAGHIPGLNATEAGELREELSRVAGTVSV